MKFLRIIGTLLLLVIVWIILMSFAIADSTAGKIVGGAALVIGLVAVWKPGLLPGLRRRWVAICLILIAAMVLPISMLDRSEFAAPSNRADSTSPDASTTTSEPASVASVPAPVVPAPQAEVVPPPEVSAKQKAEEEYLAKLDDSLKDVRAMNLGSIKGSSKDALLIYALAFGVYGGIYEEGLKLDLSSAGKAKLATYKKALSDAQRREYPRLRDEYGPALRQALWEHDGHARTFGNRFTTIEITNALFARNANIRDMHTAWRDAFEALRFKQANYKWFRQASEYQYYTMETPDDGTIAVLDRNRRWRAVE